MTRILVPFDASPGSGHALDFVVRQARTGAPLEVHLLNVQPLVLSAGDFLTTEALADYRKAHLHIGKTVLEAPAGKLAAARIPHQVHVVMGVPEAAIVDHAMRHQCEQIVMGTRGLGAIQGLFLGSVATKVIHLASVPVTVVNGVRARHPVQRPPEPASSTRLIQIDARRARSLQSP